MTPLSGRWPSNLLDTAAAALRTGPGDGVKHPYRRDTVIETIA